MGSINWSGWTPVIVFATIVLIAGAIGGWIGKVAWWVAIAVLVGVVLIGVSQQKGS